MIKKIKYFFLDGLWNFSIQEVSGFKRIGIKWLRIFYLALRAFFQDNVSFSASSLTYYSLMSIVPLLALAIAVARGFGYHDLFQEQLLDRFPDQAEAFTQLFKYADAFLLEAKGGLIAGIGFGVLFLAVLFLLHNLEDIFNNLWSVRKSRSWKRIFTDYFAILLIAPIFFVFASSMTVFVVEYLEIGATFLPLSSWVVSWLLVFVNVIPYCLFWILFVFLYLFMPNTKVPFRSGALGALIAAVFYILAQWAYIKFQVGAGRYGAIYGTMAALPLFLIWLQISWYVVLFGAQIAWAHQTYRDHEYEDPIRQMSHSFRRLMSLWFTSIALKKGILSLETLSQRFQVPLPLAKMVLQELVKCHILHESKDGYIPNAEVVEMRVSDVLKRLETHGERDFPFIEARALQRFEKTLESFASAIEKDPENSRISDVPDTI